MPSVLARYLIVVTWLASMFILIERDVLPRYIVGNPPDFKALSLDQTELKTDWQIFVEEGDEKTRPVGRATNIARKRPDGGFTLESEVRIDACGLFQGTPFQIGEATHFEFSNTTLISSQGLLDQVRADVRVRELGEKPILNIQAVPDNHGMLEVRFSSSISPILNFRQNINYAPRELVRGGLEPIDRLPGLRVGQRWNSQVLQPMTGRPEQIQSSVTGMSRIFWNNNPVEVFVVEHEAGAFTAKTWVRPDGLVLRQQLPTPIVRLVLERLLEEETP